MWMLVAIYHGLGNFWLQADDTLNSLRRQVVASGVDNDVLLAVGDYQIAVFVELADVARMDPAIDARLARRILLAPLAMHDDITAY